MSDKSLFGVTIRTSDALPPNTIAFVQRGKGRYLSTGYTHIMSNGEYTFVLHGEIQVIDPPQVIAIMKAVDDER